MELKIECIIVHGGTNDIGKYYGKYRRAGEEQRSPVHRAEYRGKIVEEAIQTMTLIEEIAGGSRIKNMVRNTSKTSE